MLEHTYTGTMVLEGEEVEVLAELLDMARMMCSSSLERKVEGMMVAILEHAEEIQTLTLDTVKILNAAALLKFESIECKFFQIFDVDNICTGEFKSLSFSAMKSFIECFNMAKGTEAEEQEDWTDAKI